MVLEWHPPLEASSGLPRHLGRKFGRQAVETLTLVRKRKEDDLLEEEEQIEHISDFVRTATTEQICQRLQKWRFQEPALRLITKGTKTICEGLTVQHS